MYIIVTQYPITGHGDRKLCMNTVYTLLFWLRMYCNRPPSSCNQEEEEDGEEEEEKEKEMNITVFKIKINLLRCTPNTSIHSNTCALLIMVFAVN